MTLPDGLDDYYCSNKFTFLKIDLENESIYNCHAARPHPVDLEWLEKNPGELFNHPINVAERQLMLEGKRNFSCQNCYTTEDLGGDSNRKLESIREKIYVDIKTTPKILDISLFADCNLACSYCCKTFSSTWKKDLLQNGPYVLDQYSEQNRYSLTEKDISTNNIKQKNKIDNKFVNLVINELDYYDSLEKVVFSGGEPFLNSSLMLFLEKLKKVKKIMIITGLGVSQTRFSSILEKLQEFDNIELLISAESTGHYYEFNRNGARWDNFQQKIKSISNQNIKFKYVCTLSNLTIFDFCNFLDFIQDSEYWLNFVQSPEFMKISNLDQISKEKIIEKLSRYDSNEKISKIIKNINLNPNSSNNRTIMRDWLKQYSGRRNLNVKIYPQHFLDWLEI